MFKEIITSTETKREYYLSDAMGHVVALRTEITPTGQPTSAAWEYYAHGAEREARLVNIDNNPKFEADEVAFFVYDHLGNTRMSYTPQIELVPTIDEEVFNHNFGALLYDWEGLDANTDVYLGSGALYAENSTGAAVAVNPGVSFEAGHTYTLTIAATEVNVSSIVVAVNNVTIGTIQNSGLTDTFTFVVPSTGLFDIHIIGNGSSGTREFYVKTIKLEDQTPAHVAYTYVINHAADYFPYGKVLREYVGREKERYLTTQHERDEETGLDYRGARYYDSDIARFLSLDPLAADFLSWSAYNYVMGNPIVFIDKNGKSPTPPDWYKDQNGNIQYHSERTEQSFIEEISTHVSGGGFVGREITTWTRIDNWSPGSVLDNPYSNNSLTTNSSFSGPSVGNYLKGVEEFGKRGGTLTKGTNGKYYNGWGGNQYVSTDRVFSKQLTKGIAKNAPIIGTALDVWEVGEGFEKDGYTIGKNTIKETAGVAGGVLGGWAGVAGGAATGAAIGSVVPIIGTAIGGIVGGIIGGIFGSWGGEAGAEAIVDGVAGD